MTSPAPRSVASHFQRELSAYGAPARVVVAVSGGLDSSVLLHLARFAIRDSGHEWMVAHFDHRMRPSSANDARWVAGLARAWGLPVRIGVADEPPTSEESAREARYSFLETVRAETGSSLILTAHHADDQAETVLFRLLRGAGGRGLRGIPSRRGPAIARPLLDCWRSELEEYAEEVCLAWREDPTNRDPKHARNVLRNRILPDAERLVATGARRSLVRLADRASDEEGAWESVLPVVMAPLDVSEIGSGVTFRRKPLLELHPAVRARVVRALSTRLGFSLDHRATRRAVDFAASGVSGHAIDLGGFLSFGVELDRCVLAPSSPVGEERPLEIRDAGPGRGTVVLAGSPIPVRWGGAEAVNGLRRQRFDATALRFPLVVRSRRPGDRIRLRGGTKKVKKVLLEGRIPPSERHRTPLLVDAEGAVLWIPGLAEREWDVRAGASDELHIGIG